jgi:hypothetical protein
MTPPEATARERERIVAWLREDAAKTRADLARLHSRRALTMQQTAQWEDLILVKTGIADAIERGDHLTQAEEG